MARAAMAYGLMSKAGDSITAPKGRVCVCVCVRATQVPRHGMPDLALLRPIAGPAGLPRSLA
ncbi:hypothetical protein LZ30DRAFT_734688 [Colletotrichum cereale]|nr:hypothetical protein LZ30DRAFT_734688 [Colletotrichum cereale]